MDLLLSHLWNWWYIFAIGVGLLWWFIGTIAGGRTLITITILLLFGIPAPVAIASSKFGSLWYSVGAIKKFISSWSVVRKYVLPMALLAVSWGYIWWRLLLDINQDILLPGIAILLLVLAPLLFIKKDIGEISTQTSSFRKHLGGALYFLAAIYGGVFGWWVGLLIAYVCIFFFGFTILQVKATNIIPWFLLNLTAVIIFIQAWLVDFLLWAMLFIGMLVGWYIGAHVAIAKWNRWLKYALALFIVFSAGKLLWPYVF